jgi:hypothetical protein
MTLLKMINGNKKEKRKTNHWFEYGRKTIKLTVYFLRKTQTVTLNLKSDNRKTNTNPQKETPTLSKKKTLTLNPLKKKKFQRFLKKKTLTLNHNKP